jgi:hypothetical protein
LGEDKPSQRHKRATTAHNRWFKDAVGSRSRTNEKLEAEEYQKLAFFENHEFSPKYVLDRMSRTAPDDKV